MTTVQAVEQALYDWAPRELAESWDNVGLLVGDPDAPVSRILIALDITPAVVREAADTGCQLIVAHHPVMNCAWHQVQTLRTDDRQGRVLTDLVRHNIAAICMHTNLDAAEGGVNDILALEDMPPVPGGDERYASLNYVPLSVWAELSRAKAGTGGNNNG